MALLECTSVHVVVCENEAGEPTVPGVIGEPSNIGILIWKADEMEEVQQMLAAAGWQLATHAIGDRAIARFWTPARRLRARTLKSSLKIAVGGYDPSLLKLQAEHGIPTLGQRPRRVG